MKKKKCVLNVPPVSAPDEERDSQEVCPPQIGKTVWDYKPRVINGAPDSHCTAVPDYSRFALDRTQQATIDLTLLATNQGTVFYDFIDQSRLGGLTNIIAPGNRSTGAVFPKFDITAKDLTTFDMSVQMPQTIFHAPSGGFALCEFCGEVIGRWQKGERRHVPPAQAARPSVRAGGGVTVDNQGNVSPELRDILGENRSVILKDFFDRRQHTFDFIPEERRLRPSSAGASKALKGAAGKQLEAKHEDNKVIIRPTKRPAARKEKEPPKNLFTEREYKLVANDLLPENQFISGCGGDGLLRVDNVTEIDYLKLKDTPHNVVAHQNDQLTFQGSPEVALDTLNLTSSFEIVLDMSAGTKNIFRIFPMALAPQNGDQTGSHSHIEGPASRPEKEGRPAQR